MNRAEVLKLLAMAAIIDPRVSRKTEQEKSAMASAWIELLGDMTFDFAANQLKIHYQNSTDAIMPADLVKPWRMYKRNESEKAKAIGHTGNVKTKMPEEVRAKFVEIGALKP
jgi:hypothetical protein